MYLQLVYVALTKDLALYLLDSTERIAWVMDGGFFTETLSRVLWRGGNNLLTLTKTETLRIPKKICQAYQAVSVCYLQH